MAEREDIISAMNAEGTSALARPLEAAPPAPAAPAMAQLPELTSMRFLAALSVLVGHFGPFLAWKGWSFDFAGGLGVSFFFVLSGFILTYRYWDDFSAGVSRRTYRHFLVARVARVYPSYVLALVLITAMYVVLNALRPGIHAYPPNPVTSWLANLLALQTFAPTYATQQAWNAPSWSISTELFFYYAFPFILVAMARRAAGPKRLSSLLALVVAYAVVTQLAMVWVVAAFRLDIGYWVDLIASRNILWRLPEFLTGMVAARLLYGGHLPALRSVAVRNTVLACALAIIVLNAGGWPTIATETLAARQLRLDVGSMIPYAAVIVALAAGPTLVSPVLGRPAGVFLGDISFGVYIYHWIPWTILAIAIDRGMAVSNSLVAAVIFATIIFAAASYIWYEKPVRSYIRDTLG